MNFVEHLSHARMMAIVRASTAADAGRTVEILLDCGVSLIEVSLTTPRAVDVIRSVSTGLPDGARLGAGTVMSSAQAEQALQAGASFLVTPALSEGAVAGIAHGAEVLVGALTPTEVHVALGLGAAAIKIFPASMFGPDYLQALAGPFPETPFLPVGGIEADVVPEYLAAGAVAVGVGSPLTGRAGSPPDEGRIRSRCQLFLEAVDTQAPSPVGHHG